MSDNIDKNGWVWYSPHTIFHIVMRPNASKGASMLGLYIGAGFLFFGLISWLFGKVKVQGARAKFTKYPMAEPLAGVLNAIGGICVATWFVWSALTNWVNGVVSLYDYMITNFFWLTFHLLAIAGTFLFGCVLMLGGRWVRAYDHWFGIKLDNMGFAMTCIAVVATAVVSMWAVFFYLL